MEQAGKSLVELLIEADYITSKDSNYPWWNEDVTVGAVNKNYKNYKYYYCLNDNYGGKNAVFYIDYYSICSVLEKENNMSTQQVKDLTSSTLGDHYNFMDIATFNSFVMINGLFGEHYNY